MQKLAVSTCALVAVMLAAARAQAPATPPDAQYLFIDAESEYSKWTRTFNFHKIGARLEDAGNRGFALQWLARRSPSASMILKRDGQGPRSYRFIAEGKEGSFLKVLNEAGSQGFRLLPDTIRVLEQQYQTTWIAVMAKHAEAAPFTYSVVKGVEEGQRALADAAASGRALEGILARPGITTANTLLFFEDAGAAKVLPAAPGQSEFRIITTTRTSTLEKELAQAAAERFRLVGTSTGYMTAVMARDARSTDGPVEYRVLAMTLAKTEVAELAAVGADGFRIAAPAENGMEAVYILQRTPGTSQRFEHRTLMLEEATADRLLREAEAEGYRVVALLNDLVVLERP
jgi:hypothetical protein